MIGTVNVYARVDKYRVENLEHQYHIKYTYL